MSTPELSDTLTDGIRVGASAYYIPDQSDPDRQQFSFGYNIVIVNSGAEPAQLISRHWIIIDAHGRREEVKGPGVVGQTPRLQPGEGFKYTSYCPLKTRWGTMEGTYTMRRDNGETFQVQIGRFYLTTDERKQG